MQGTEVLNMRAGNEVVRTDQPCISRNPLLGSRGISAANSSSSGSAKMSSPRFARFREDSNLESCFYFHRKPRRTNSQSLLLQHHPAAPHRATLNEALFESKRSQATFLVFQAKEEDE